MNTIGLDLIRESLEGTIPGIVATCSADGMPNVAYLSQTEYVDQRHIALSYQFFNTTRRNVLENPHARLIVTHPQSAERHRLLIRYLRTETAGPLFERMRAKLAGIASHTGMSGVFRLLGSDVYAVLDIERVPASALPAAPPRRSLLAALRATTDTMAAAADLETLLTDTLAALKRHFGMGHAMVLMLDAAHEKLYTVASLGYERSGVGSEIRVGDGVIGMAARHATPIRIGHMTLDAAYGRAIRAEALDGGLAGALETEIPLPGLPESRSQLAVPIRAAGRLLGILYAESAQDLRFGYDEEDALAALAAQVGAAVLHHQHAADTHDDAAPTEPVMPAGTPVEVRRYAENDSVFLDGEYLIKGVAGTILWAMLHDYIDRGRVRFSNRELRLDPRIRLPDLSDNLEARLILLRRRLDEHDACVRLVSAGRGLLRLEVRRPRLVEVAGPPR